MNTFLNGALGAFVGVLGAYILVFGVWYLRQRRRKDRAAELLDESIEARDEARAAATLAADRAAAVTEMHRHFVEGVGVAAGIRNQCGEILEDMRSLRGWPTDAGNGEGR